MTQLYNDVNNIVTKLVLLRKQSKFSQQDMANILNVSRKKINEFENGKFDFDLFVNYSYKMDMNLTIIDI